jgi:hypothetical protein
MPGARGTVAMQLAVLRVAKPACAGCADARARTPFLRKAVEIARLAARTNGSSLPGELA